MPIRKILQLGNPRLYEVCHELSENDLPSIREQVQDLHDTMIDFRDRYKAGRAIAAPQIGYMKRLVYMHIDRPTVFINPVLSDLSEDRIEIWDDCMSFPELLVRLQRHRTCRISYLDLNWENREMILKDDLSELLQHECDHLDGILATSRALGPEAFCSRAEYLTRFKSKAK